MKLAQADIKVLHTHQEEEIDRDKPSQRQNSAGNEKEASHQTTNHSGVAIATTLSFPSLQVKKSYKNTYTSGTGSTSAALCDVKPYITFVELAFCLHADLHYSKDLPLETRCRPKVFDRGIRKFLGLFNANVYRGDDSVDTDSCKIHCHFHILQNILMYGDPMQYDAAKGERGLKEWTKLISQTAQPKMWN